MSRENNPARRKEPTFVLITAFAPSIQTNRAE